MPEYEFRDEESGRTILVDMTMSEAGEIDFGQVIKRDGRTLCRLVPSGVNRDGVRVAPKQIVLHQVVKGTAGAQAYTKAGRPAFESEGAAQEFLARQNGDGANELQAEWDR